MTTAELERLVDDHPEVLWMSTDEMYRRFWMYDGSWVAFARMQVRWNQLAAILARPLISVLDLLARKGTP